MVRTVGFVVTLVTAEVGACLLEPPRPPLAEARDDAGDDAAPPPAAPDEASAADALASLRGALSVFLDGVGYDASASAAANAEVVRAAVRAACADASITHDPGASSVGVDFSAGCDVGGRGVVVTGTASATAAIEVRGLVLHLTTTSLAVDGYVFDGAVAATTTDGTAWTLVADLAVEPVGAVTFAGTATMSGDGVVLDGVGVLQTGVVAAMELAGASCTSDGTVAFSIDGLHKEVADCRPDDGLVAGTRALTCVFEDRRREIWEAVAALGTTTQFRVDAPTTGLVETQGVATIGSRARATTATASVRVPRATCGG